MHAWPRRDTTFFDSLSSPLPSSTLDLPCAHGWSKSLERTGKIDMLILTRRPNETVCIGDDVRITVLAVNGAQVRIGIEAPRSVVVDREEIYARKRAQAAGRAAPLPGVCDRPRGVPVLDVPPAGEVPPAGAAGPP